MTTAILSTKGQLVIPARYRKAMNLHAGDRVAIDMEGVNLVVKHVARRHARLVSEHGRKVLRAPSGAPPMTPDFIKSILADQQ